MDARPQQLSSPRVPRSGRAALSLLSRLRHGRLDLVAPEGQTFTFNGPLPGPDAVLQVHDWSVFDAVLRSGDIGFAEAYLDGRWQTPDLHALLLLAATNRLVIERALHGTWWGQVFARLRHLMRANTRARARRNIEAHYDLGNDFYRAWLDPTMTYSAALFGGDTGRSLEQAQLAKYERILDRLGARAGDRILEIGCGWGGFAAYASRTRRCHVSGITLSPAQLAYARQRVAGEGLSDRVGLALVDYRDVRGRFDHVVSIEMFEAVGERFWPQYFGALRDRLKPGGGAVVQTITIADELFAHYRRSTDFIQRYIFPGGMLPSATAFRALAGNAGLRITDEFAFGEDYARTLQHWHRRYAAAAAGLRPLGFDSRFERLWNFYLAYCEAGFRLSTTDVIQFEIRHA